MAINVKVTKGDKGDGNILLKRFQKKVIESGVIPKVKGMKHAARKSSKLKNKNDKLVKLESAKKYEVLKKMGKLQTKSYKSSK